MITLKSVKGGLLVPVKIDTRHPSAASYFDTPHLENIFSQPEVISMRTVTVGGNTFDVYVSHIESSHRKEDSVVLVIKRRWGTCPSNMIEGDQAQVVVAIDRYDDQYCSASRIPPSHRMM